MYITSEEQLEVVKMLKTRGTTKKMIAEFLKVSYKTLDKIIQNEEEWFKTLYYSRFKSSITKSITIKEEDKMATKGDIASMLESLLSNSLESTQNNNLLENKKSITKSNTDEEIIYNEIPSILPFKISKTDVKQTSIKVDREIWEEFDKSCKRDKKHSKIEMLSLALKEFTEKYY